MSSIAIPELLRIHYAALCSAHLHRRNFANLDGRLCRYQVSSLLLRHLALVAAVRAPACCSGGPTRLRWACYEAAVRYLSRSLPCDRSRPILPSVLSFGERKPQRKIVVAGVADTTTTSPIHPLTPPRWIPRPSSAESKGKQ